MLVKGFEKGVLRVDGHLGQEMAGGKLEKGHKEAEGTENPFFGHGKRAPYLATVGGMSDNRLWSASEGDHTTQVVWV